LIFNHIKIFNFFIVKSQKICCVLCLLGLYLKPQNQLMKTIRFFRSFLTALFKLCALKLTQVVSLLSFIDKHDFSPRPPQKQGCGGLARIAIFNAGCCHELYYTLLFDKQFVPCCTTKYIFWLGKNKFV